VSRRHKTKCDRCGASIELVLVVPAIPKRDTVRSYVPLDPELPADLQVAPSHALSAGRTWCHQITDDNPLAPHEHPAITHFATCPARVARPQEAS